LWPKVAMKFSPARASPKLMLISVPALPNPFA
jgi:hypothetical protein